MIRRPPRSTLSSSSAASDVYKRQLSRPLGATAKNKAPERGSTSVSGVFHLHRILAYIAQFWPKSKPYRVAKAQFSGNKPAILTYRLTAAPDRPFPATRKGGQIRGSAA